MFSELEELADEYLKDAYETSRRLMDEIAPDKDDVADFANAVHNWMALAHSVLFPTSERSEDSAACDQSNAIQNFGVVIADNEVAELSDKEKGTEK